MTPTESKKTVEIKNIYRSDTQPVFLKEKIAENGQTRTVIYQRKNIDQINGFFEKLKTKIHYTAEDLSQKFEINSLKKILGFTSLTTLVSGTESKAALVDYKHKLNTTGTVDHSTQERLTYFFNNKNSNFLNNVEFKINIEKYDTSEFLIDLEKIRKSARVNEKCGTHTLALIYFEQSISDNLMTREEVKQISEGFETIKTVIDNYFIEQKAPEKMQKRFMDKLDRVREETINSEPTDKEMKEWCLKNEKNRYNYYGQGYRGNQRETDPNILKSIHHFFSSTSSAKEKQIAHNVLKSFYENERDELPLHIEKKIFPEMEGFYESSFLPTLNSRDNDRGDFIASFQRRSPNDTTLESPGKIQNFSENNQGLLSGAVTHGIYTDRKLKTSSSTSNPQRKTTEDDD